MDLVAVRRLAVRWPYAVIIGLGLVIVLATRPAPSEADAHELWRFVVVPDWLNNDVAYPDPLWDPALNFILGEIAREQPDFVLVPGDLVMGRWHISPEHISMMAEKYYGDWVKRIEAHDLVVYPTVGDHELGDDPWPAEKAALLPHFEDAFRRYFPLPNNGPSGLEGLVYSFDHRGCRFIALYPFEVDDDGEVRVRVTGDQLDWLKDTLATPAEIDCKIVMAHTPVLPGAARRSSSGLENENGLVSALWETMVANDVNLYLNGELHAFSATEMDGLLQIVSGSQPSNVPEANYLVVRVFADSLEVELKSIKTQLVGEPSVDLDPYGLDTMRGRHITISEASRKRGFQTLGSLMLEKRGNRISRRDGVFSQIDQYRKVGSVKTVGPGKHEDGYAYFTGLDASSDEYRLVLFEDGKPLPMSHRLHKDIREKGGGRYSHWGKHLYFSSSDNTDPYANGAVYTYQLYERRKI